MYTKSSYVQFDLLADSVSLCVVQAAVYSLSQKVNVFSLVYPILGQCSFPYPLKISEHLVFWCFRKEYRKDTLAKSELSSCLAVLFFQCNLIVLYFWFFVWGKKYLYISVVDWCVIPLRSWHMCWTLWHPILNLGADFAGAICVLSYEGRIH